MSHTEDDVSNTEGQKWEWNIKVKNLMWYHALGEVWPKKLLLIFKYHVSCKQCRLCHCHCRNCGCYHANSHHEGYHAMYSTYLQTSLFSGSLKIGGPWEHILQVQACTLQMNQYPAP